MYDVHARISYGSVCRWNSHAVVCGLQGMSGMAGLGVEDSDLLVQGTAAVFVIRDVSESSHGHRARILNWEVEDRC